MRWRNRARSARRWRRTSRGCPATGKCCGGKYYWDCSRDSDAGRHGKCINGWNGKQCCRSDGRKYGQCSGWNLCGQQCHKNTTDVTEVTEQNTTQETIQDVTQTAEPAVAETPTVEAVAQPTHYTIQRGDTLIGISLRNYGSNSKVSEICS